MTNLYTDNIQTYCAFFKGKICPLLSNFDSVFLDLNQRSFFGCSEHHLMVSRAHAHMLKTKQGMCERVIHVQDQPRSELQSVIGGK